MPPADFLCFTFLFASLRLTRFDVCAPSSQVDSQMGDGGESWKSFCALLWADSSPPPALPCQTLRRVTKSGSHY